MRCLGFFTDSKTKQRARRKGINHHPAATHGEPWSGNAEGMQRTSYGDGAELAPKARAERSKQQTKSSERFSAAFTKAQSQSSITAQGRTARSKHKHNQ
jgi:hypothetical protein